MDVIKTHEISSRAIEKVMVHPLVLLSVVDHYNRVDKDLPMMDTRKRVVGVLPFLLKKMRRTQAYGFWITTTMNPCFPCSRGQMDATQKSHNVFVHVLSEIAAHEVEEIGVEHLLRDVKDTTISSLATEIDGKLKALKSLDGRLREIRSYLDLVIDGKLPLNH